MKKINKKNILIQNFIDPDWQNGVQLQQNDGSYWQEFKHINLLSIRMFHNHVCEGLSPSWSYKHDVAGESFIKPVWWVSELVSVHSHSAPVIQNIPPAWAPCAALHQSERPLLWHGVWATGHLILFDGLLCATARIPVIGGLFYERTSAPPESLKPFCFQRPAGSDINRAQLQISGLA